MLWRIRWVAALIAFRGLLAALACGAEQSATEQPIKIVNPQRLAPDDIAAVRTPLGLPNDYKPWIAQLKSGELLIVGFCYGGTPSDKLPPGVSYLERAIFWRSRDEGRTWQPREERPDLHGREFALNCLADGTLLMPCHFLANDAANQAGYTYSKIFRSVDEGRTWSEQRVGPEGFPKQAVTLTDWTAIELPDPARPGKTLVQLGVSIFQGGDIAPSNVFLWRSTDSGATWDKSLLADTDGWIDADGFFSQSTTYRSHTGVLWHPVRVDCSGPHWKLPAASGAEVRSGDQDDRTMLWRSTDDGRSWRPHADGGRFGTYGEMYPRFLPMRDGRLLLTFTVRSNSTDGFPLGLRALISSDDGQSWDFSHDRLVIGNRNHGASGGGFGNTIQLHDGAPPLRSQLSWRGRSNARRGGPLDRTPRSRKSLR